MALQIKKGEIKSKYNLKCKSAKLRRRAIEESMNLTNLLLTRTIE